MTDVHALAGRTLGAYRIDRLLGRGGMGDVFLAHDTRLGRPVALKVLAEALAQDERLRARLVRESRLAASLDHPNVVPIYDAGEVDGRLFIAMRYVDGADVKALLRAEGPLDGERAVAIAAQVADALDAAHRRGLVHRDVKPSNVLLDHRDEREHAYLADFGLTQSHERGAPADGQFMGTVDYVAPEQIRGDPVDGRADQYALGCLLFEALTGSLPFPRGSEVAAIYAHLEEPAPSAREHRDALPSAVDPVLQRAMAKEPGDRFPSCRALVDATRTALGLDAARPRRRLVAGLALAAAALAAVAAALVLDGGGEHGGGGPAGALVRIDPRSDAVAARTRVPGHPGAVAVTAGGVWIADFHAGALWRDDPQTGRRQRIASTGEPHDLAAMGHDVYVAADGNGFTGTVSRYDARTGARRDTLDLLACALASGEGVVWAAGCPLVERLSTDGRPLRKLLELPLPFRNPASAADTRISFSDMAVGAGAVWVLGDALDRRLWRLDPRDGTVEATIALPFPPRSVAVAGDTVWITDPLHDTVVPVDAAANRVLAPVGVGRGAAGVAAGAGAVWVAGALDGTVSRVDPDRRRVAATIRVGGAPAEIAANRDAVWVTSDAP